MNLANMKKLFCRLYCYILCNYYNVKVNGWKSRSN